MDRNTLKVIAAATALGLLAACGGGAEEDSDVPDEQQATSGEPVEVEVWSWVTDLQTEADVYNAANPGVHVTVTNAGQATPSYEKLRNAIQAGTGIPDAIFLDAGTLPGFVAEGQVIDLTTLGADEHEADQLPWAWGQLSVDGSLYAAPAGLGPAVFFYRKDLYAQYGLEVPATWEEFEVQAQRLQVVAPDAYLANFPTFAPHFEGLISQAGHAPFGADGDTVTIDLESEETERVAQYWQSMLDQGLVFNSVEYMSNEWNQAVTQGKLVSVIGGAWLPLFLQSLAPDTAGNWGVAQLPQWSSSESVAFDAGVAGYAIPTDAEHPQEAADFLWWLTGSDEGVQMLVDLQSQFPSYLPILESEEYLSLQDPFFGGQEVRREYVAAAQGLQPYPMTPVQDFVVNEFNQQLAAAVAGQMTVSDALAAIQSNSRAFAEQQGYDVE